MGCYDVYCDEKKDISIQLKNGFCELKIYKIGDEVYIKDGVYVGNEGVVTIHEGKLLRVDKELNDKWGGIIDIEEILNPDNPISQAMDRYEETLKEEDDGRNTK